MVRTCQLQLVVLSSLFSIFLTSQNGVSGSQVEANRLAFRSTPISNGFQGLDQRDDVIPEGVEKALSQAGTPSKSASEVERTSASDEAGESKTGEGGRWGKTKLPSTSAAPTSIVKGAKHNKQSDKSNDPEEFWTWKGGAFGCLDGATARGSKALCSASIDLATDPLRSLFSTASSSSVEMTSSTSKAPSKDSSSSVSSKSSSTLTSKSKSTSSPESSPASNSSASSSSSSSTSSSSSSSASAAKRFHVAQPTHQARAEGLLDVIGIIESALSSVSSVASVRASQAVGQASKIAEIKSKSSAVSSSNSNQQTSTEVQKAAQTSSASGSSASNSTEVDSNASPTSTINSNSSAVASASSSNHDSSGMKSANSTSHSDHKKRPKSTLTGSTTSPLPTSNEAYASKLARRQDTFTGYPTTTLALAPSSTPTYETLSDLAQTFSSVQPSGRGPSGNGDPPADINNLDSPDLPWLDLIVGGIPYKNGDLAASIVWILATTIFVPLFLIRLLRRSSLISMVLFTIFIYMILLVATFGIRAYIANNGPTTPLMIAENAMLSVSIPLLTEPLLHLLGLYASQGTKNSGVPTATAVLRFLNFVSLLLYVVAATYIGLYLRDWDNILRSDGLVNPEDLPNSTPIAFVRIAPIVASFFLLLIILGGLLLLPVARGESGNSKPGGFLALLFILLAIPVIYRILQTLHASAELQGDGSSDNPFSPVFNLGSPPMRLGNNRVLAELASDPDSQDDTIPPGMYNPMEKGIAWSQLQQTLAGRGRPQTPLIFNLVYVLPQWLMVFLFFFVHAPGNQGGGGGGGDKNGTKVDVKVQEP